MCQRKQQHITGSVRRQIIQDRIDSLDLLFNRRFNLLQKINPIGRRPLAIIFGQGFAGRWLEGSEDIAFGSPPIINLLLGTLTTHVAFGYNDGLNQSHTGLTFGCHRPHLIQADYDTARRWRAVEPFNRPLFSANSGSTRSPNQVSWLRQRKPSAISNSSMRERLMAKALCSLRYACNRDSVHLAKGRPSFCGSVKAAAMTSATWPEVYVGGRPLRGKSLRPASPLSLKRLSQVRTVFSERLSFCAIIGTDFGCEARRTMRARSTQRAGLLRERASLVMASCSSAVSSLSFKAIGHLIKKCPEF